MTNYYPEEIETAALHLNAVERTQLEESPLSSLPMDDEILAAWAEEAEHRIDFFERGKMTAIDFNEAIFQSRAKLAFRNIA